MRPLRLQLDGLTAFRSRQDLVLGPHDLFAISGPTGAGKSSLLDALVFALYGKVPRGLQPRELIALGRSQGWVLLEWSADGRRYRVTRKLIRGQRGAVQTQAQLEELEQGGERALADGVTATNAAVQRIVGLTFEAFTQAVILPQGDFARFLQAEPRARNAILRDLLRLSVYERMRQRAHELSRALKSELDQREHVLREEYAGATAEALEAERLAAEASRAASEAAAAEAAVVEAELVGDGGLRARAALTRERLERHARAAELAEAARRWAGDERRLDAARRAAAVLPRLEALESAEARLTRAQSEARAAAATLEAAAKALSAAQAQAEQADREAAVLPALEARLGGLGRALALVGPLEAARQQAAEAQADVARRERQQRLAATHAENALQAAARAEREAAEGRRAFESIDYDRAAHERLEAAREPLAALAQRRDALQAARDELRAACSALEQLEDARRAAKTAAQSAAEAFARAADARAAADAGLRAAERQHAAAHLRAGLRAGEACPVCERKLVRLPAAATAPLLDVLREPAERAARAEAEAGERLAAAREQAARDEASCLQAREAHAHREARCQQLAGELQSLEAHLRETLGDGDESRLRDALKRLAAARERSLEAQRALERAEADAQRAGLVAEQSRTSAAEAERELGAARARAEAADAANRDLRAQLDALAAGPDPAAELRETEQRRDALRTAAASGAHALARAREHEAVARAGASASADARDRAAGEAAAAATRAASALEESGFADAAAARAAALGEGAQQALRQALQAGRAESTAVAQRLHELDLALATGGGPVSPGELAGHEARLGAARAAAERALRDAAEHESRLAELTRRTAQAERFAAELKDLRSRQATYKGLSDDLRSDQFQAWLLEETFRELVSGASQRLLELSGRYTFAYADDEFHVLDHDHAGERRRADSLSGGETFLASLALALELSQQVQRAAGAVHLDSLFIDEGFGTLDPETLDTIAGAIENLGVAGRMVGIVTHVPELTARLPVRFMVRKRPEGSDVVVEGA